MASRNLSSSASGEAQTRQAATPAPRRESIVSSAPGGPGGPLDRDYVGRSQTASRAHPRKVRHPKRRRVVHENSVLLMALAGGALAVAVALGFLWAGDYTPKTQWTATIFIVLLWISCGFGVRSMVVRPLQTLSNMHAALREGDFSMRARAAGRHDALSELMFEINTLAEAMREQHLGALEGGALLNKVIAEIDVAIFAFDAEQRLRLVNRAGERLLAQNVERLLGRTAGELGLAEGLEGPAAMTLEKSFPGGSGRFGVRRSTFRQGGVPHHLLVMADLSRALREEERQAWQRLVRVLGHELNNSLAPIRSIADSLELLLKRDPRPADWEDDLRRGLHIISERSESLSRFMRDYARLARLPRPEPRPVELGPLLRRIAGLETRAPVEVADGQAVTIAADPDQLEQVLINVIRNAVDATLENQGAEGHGAEGPGRVRVTWSRNGASIEVRVLDEGPGISNPTNLFVPFFTTKPGGSGIGLALSRQIVEGHGGAISLHNRGDAHGCEARILLPIRASAALD